MGPTTKPELNVLYRRSDFLKAEEVASHLSIDTSTVVQIAYIAGMFQLDLVPDEYNRRLWELLSKFLRWTNHRVKVAEDALNRALSGKKAEANGELRTKADLDKL